LLLLRALDPENETAAPLAFGYKQLLHEPIMGGGVPDLYRRSVGEPPGGWLVFGISTVVIVFWIVVWWFLKKKSA